MYYCLKFFFSVYLKLLYVCYCCYVTQFLNCPFQLRINIYEIEWNIFFCIFRITARSSTVTLWTQLILVIEHHQVLNITVTNIHSIHNFNKFQLSHHQCQCCKIQINYHTLTMTINQIKLHQNIKEKLW